MILPVEKSFSIQFDTTEKEFLEGLGILDLCEKQMETLPPASCPTEHQFIKGEFGRYYVRTIFMPAGSLITSKIHRTEHPFHIPSGDVSVWTRGVGTTRYVGPYSGITKPMTKRLLYVHQDTIWSTFHPGSWGTVEEVERDIIMPHVNSDLQIPYFDCYNRPPTHRLDGAPIDHNYVLHND